MASSNSPPPSSSTPSPPSPPSSLSPPPSASQPPPAQPNATSDPPASSNAPPPLPSTSPPPLASPPPPSLPNSPPPATNSPPPASPSPPPLTLVSPPPSSAHPPTPTLTPPPPQAIPPAASPPPPLPPTLPPPAPPTSSPPPATLHPPSPQMPVPPASSFPPPPAANPPVPLPPSPIDGSPPPSRSQTPPTTPSTPPPKEQPPSVPSPPPSNASSGTPPADSNVPSPPLPAGSPPLPSPAPPSGDSTNPISPSGNKASSSGPNVTEGSGHVNNGGGGGGKAGVIVPVAVVTSLVVLSLIGLAVWYFRKKKRRTGGYAAGFIMPSPLASSQMSESPYTRSPSAPLVYHSSGGGSHGFMNSPSDHGLGDSKSWFSYEELYKVTNGFSDKNLLGEGGFGCVYKGCLADGREVAVKQLKVGGSQGEREFRAEVEIIGRVHHRHLVSLVGFCIADKHRLLVYDYVPNNTLHYHLHEGKLAMDWAIRVKVATGAARGIAYLHEDCHPRIIHRDIKSSNILLDNNFEAQVSDFGLARLAADAATHVTTRVMGTFGYLAPEYASSGKLTERSDVYSFGVVLLELITGRKPVDSSQPLGDESIVEWARPLMTRAIETGEFDDLPDPKLEKNYNEAEMFRMIETAAACVRHSAAMRPRMGLVARALDGLADIDLSNGIRPGQSELFSAQSAEIRLFQRMAFGSQDLNSADFSNYSNFSRTSLRSQRDS